MIAVTGPLSVTYSLCYQLVPHAVNGPPYSINGPLGPPKYAVIKTQYHILQTCGFDSLTQSFPTDVLRC